jgi:two-component system, NtrC family, sensor histidine kinase PilS
MADQLLNLKSPERDDSLNWKSLHQLNFYRFVLASSLLTAFHASEWMSFLGNIDPEIFLACSLSFLVSSLIFLVLGFKSRVPFESQIMLSNASDIILITLLAHFSGGLSSSLGILLIINVTATGTFLRNRDSFLFAALASIAILSEQTYSMMQGISYAADYSRAGLLGLVFFGTSFLASILANRARESEQLAIERKADIADLEILNEDIIQNMRTGIIVVDNNGHIRMSNSSAEALLGNISLQADPLLENILPALDSRFLEWQEQPNMYHKAIPQALGLPDIQPGFRKLQRTGDTLIFLEDATQLNQRFQQIKLASLGRLTASIAHEIRNPLSAINHAAQLLQESELDMADTKLTGIITAQVQRLDKVVQNVLELSRSKKGNTETIELHEWLNTFCAEFMPSNNLKANQLLLEAQANEVLVLFDSSHLNQVMCNLCTNVINHSGLEIENIKIQINCGHDAANDQPYLDVLDNGQGIPKKIARQIFDPFYTTNPQGTGLGLYITKEIIESNRGRIRYINQEHGSCFRIHFLTTHHM